MWYEFPMAMSSQADKQESPSAAQPPSERIPRMVIIGIFGGVPAGLVGGIGSRLIMRILAMVNEGNAGAMTENGNISGEITASGTVGLIIGVGIVSGVIGGFVYVMIRRWLPGCVSLHYPASLWLPFSTPTTSILPYLAQGN